MSREGEGEGEREQWDLTEGRPLCQIKLQNHLKHEIGYQ